MNRKPFFFLLLIPILILSGCIKETYNMKKLSDNMKYSPTFSVMAASGNITFSDIVKPGDTVKIDNNKFVSIIFRKDSVINMKLKDYYDLSNMVAFSKGYKIGELKIDDFRDSILVSLATISSFLSPALVNGSTMNILPFSINIGEKSFGLFSNFQNAVFSSGTLTISVNNGLGFPLQNVKVSLFNSAGHTAIGSQLTFPSLPPGIQTATIDLAGKTLTNSIMAAILIGSPGASSVLVNFNRNLVVGLSATNLKVQSGRIILPTQSISSLSGTDVITFNPGNNVEIENIKMTAGNIGYTLVSNSSISGSFSFTLPTALRSSTPISDIISINGPTNVTGSISVNSTDVNLTTDVNQNFNRIPLNYSISVNSKGLLINFSKNDSIHIAINMVNPGFDYVKGYFGQLSKQIDPEIIDPGIGDALQHITGKFYVSNPTIKLRYSNSFAIPIGVTLNAVGQRGTRSLNLGYAPFTITYPGNLNVRDINDSLTINKSNSMLDSLISMPPSQITFSGSAKMNPAGRGTGRNNYVFGNSRFLGSVEVNVPLQLWMKNLQFADTVDNFLNPNDNNNGKDSFNASDMDSLKLTVMASNGFPMGASLKLMLYDSVKKVTVKTIDATGLILPAPVDAAGKSTGKTESTTVIRFNKDFFNAASSANKIIFMFTLNTTGDGTTDVKIYSDYSLNFKASVMAKPNFKL